MQWSRSRSLFRFAITVISLSSFLAVAQTYKSAPPKFLYSTDYSGNKVHSYIVNPTTGVIQSTGQATQSTHIGPTRAVSDKSGYRLYVINQESKDLSAYFVYRNKGSLHQVPGSPFAIGRTPEALAVAPSGKYVYVITSDSSASFVYAFSVSSNGSLKPVPGSPFSTVDWAEAITTDPQGKYLYVANSPNTPQNTYVDAFSISASDGALTPVPGTPFLESTVTCGAGSWDMAVHPSGNFLVVPDGCAGLAIFRIERNTGTLAAIEGSPFPPGEPGPGIEGSVAMDPLGQYFWVSTQYCHSGCTQTTDTWKINAKSGIPTYLESGGSGCGLLTRAAPNGKFVYVIGDTQGNGCTGSTTPGIWGMAVNRANGSLKNIPGSPWKSPNSDWFLTDGLAVTP